MTDKEKQIFDKYGNYNFPTEIKQSGQNIATTQIEEMAKVIESVKLYGIDNYGRKISHDSALELAEELLKHYQSKPPEGSVVLSKEEYEELKIAKDFDYGYHEGEKNMEAYYERIALPKARKETAREILNAMLDIKPDFRLLDGCNPSEFMRSVNLATDIIFQAVKEQAKRYGVEVEE